MTRALAKWTGNSVPTRWLVSVFSMGTLLCFKPMAGRADAPPTQAVSPSTSSPLLMIPDSVPAEEPAPAAPKEPVPHPVPPAPTTDIPEAGPNAQPDPVAPPTELQLFQIEEQVSQYVARIVTASRVEEQSGESPATVTVLSHDDISRLGVTTLEEILNYVPGFQVTRDVEQGTAFRIGVRGRSKFNSEYVLVLKNG